LLVASAAVTVTSHRVDSILSLTFVVRYALKSFSPGLDK